MAIIHTALFVPFIAYVFFLRAKQNYSHFTEEAQRGCQSSEESSCLSVNLLVYFALHQVVWKAASFMEVLYKMSGPAESCSISL